MLKKLFNSVVNKYKKSCLLLNDIEEDSIKVDILNLFVLIINIDNKVDKEEVRELANFMQNTLFEDKNINEIQDIIKNIFNSLDTHMKEQNLPINETTGYYNFSFINICKELSEKLNNKQKDELLAIVIQLIHSDGVVYDTEKNLIKLFRENIEYNGVLGKKKKINDKCPSCRGGNIKQTGSEEIDRWTKPKQVTETMASGKKKIRYIQTTYVKIRVHHQCQDCIQKFTSIVNKEK